jgi:hypothetical protein
MDKCCGLDAHKDSIFACILDAQGKKILEKRFRNPTTSKHPKNRFHCNRKSQSFHTTS